MRGSKLEPRILLEDPAKSYHAKHWVIDSDPFNNRIIFGDNLLVPKDIGATNSHKNAMPYVDLTKGLYSENGRASILLPCWPSASGVTSRIFIEPVWWWPKCGCYMKAVR